MLGLNFEQAGFNCGGTTQPPQQTRQPEHQFPLNGRLGIVISNNDGFEGFVIVGIFKRTDHRLGRQPMADSVATGLQLAFFRNRAGALARIAPISFDLFKGSHGASAPANGFVLLLLIGLSMAGLSLGASRGCVASHSALAAGVGLTPTLPHHAASSPHW
jgi:hypothetical protein